MIVDPKGCPVASDPVEQEVDRAIFGLKSGMALRLAGLPPPGTILDAGGQPVNAPEFERAASPPGIAAWLPGSYAFDFDGTWRLEGARMVREP